MSVWLSRRSPADRSAGRRRKPCLEALEDRCVPASFNPTAGAVDGQANSLRAAIVAANQNGQDDVITLQPGTYQLFVPNAAGQENAAATGDLDLTEGGRTVTIQGAGAGVTVIDGGSVDRVFHILGGVTAIFRDLTIRNGFAQNDGTPGIPFITPDAHGGGILNQGTLTLDHVIVEESSAAGETGFNGGSGPGGSNGTAGKAAQGGGIYNSGTLSLNRSTVRNNTAVGGIGGTGGQGTTFVRWHGGPGGAASGGGVWSSGSLSLSQSTLHNNQARGGDGGAGGIGEFGGDGGAGGRALGGGLAVAAGAGQSLVTNSTISGNTAVGGAGGFRGIGEQLNGSGGSGGDGVGGGVATESTLALRNSTVAANQARGGDGVGGGATGAGQGGGVRALGGGSAVTSVSTLIGDNSSTSLGADFSGSFQQATFTLVENGNDALGIADGVNGNLVGQDPRLGSLGNNGGPTPTHALLPGSPAINAGSNPFGLGTDQRGFPRISRGSPDIGAYEFFVPATPPPPAPLPRGLRAFLEVVKVKKQRRLRVVVLYADTGELKGFAFSPYSQASFRNIVARAIDTNGDGIPDTVEVEARQLGGRKRFVKTTVGV